jgi:hypothetical protein
MMFCIDLRGAAARVAQTDVPRDAWGFPLCFAPIIHPHFDAFLGIEQALPHKPSVRVKAGRQVIA